MAVPLLSPRAALPPVVMARPVRADLSPLFSWVETVTFSADLSSASKRAVSLRWALFKSSCSLGVSLPERVSLAISAEAPALSLPFSLAVLLMEAATVLSWPVMPSLLSAAVTVSVRVTLTLVVTGL